MPTHPFPGLLPDVQEQTKPQNQNKPMKTLIALAFAITALPFANAVPTAPEKAAAACCDCCDGSCCQDGVCAPGCCEDTACCAI
jgi:hypothetical protein